MGAADVVHAYPEEHGARTLCGLPAGPPALASGYKCDWTCPACLRAYDEALLSGEWGPQ